MMFKRKHIYESAENSKTKLQTIIQQVPTKPELNTTRISTVVTLICPSQSQTFTFIMNSRIELP
jgi:hypothetical protein